MAWFEADDARIYFEDEGSGPPVLLLPGFADTIGGHATLREALHGRYRVIAADLPGSGRSGPQPRDYQVGFYEKDGRAFLALLRHLGAVPAHVLGFSDGGEVALMMAALAPEATRSVFTWGAAGAVADPGGTISAAFGTVVDNPIPEFIGFRDYLIATYGEDVARASTRSFANAITAMVAAGGEIIGERAANIACPVMMVAGERDFIVPKALMDNLAIRIARAETREVEGAGHVVHQDRPDWIVDAASAWLAAH